VLFYRLSTVKILFLISSLRLGGAEKMAINLAVSLASAGHKVVICHYSSTGELLVPVMSSLTAIRLKSNNLAGSLPELARVIRSENIEVAVCNFWKLTSLCLAVKLMVPRLRVFSWEHGFYPTKELLFRVVSKTIFAFLDGVLYASPGLLEHLSERYSLQHSFVFIPNPVLEEARHSEVRELCCEQRLTTFTCITRIETCKGVDTLIDAWRYAGLSGKARLEFVGSGSKLEYCRTEMSEDSSVFFHGFQADYTEILQAADIVVVPSLSEGFCNIIIEALAYRKRIVVTKCGSIFQLLPNADQYGTLVTPGEVENLGNALVAEYLRSKAELPATGVSPVVEIFTSKRSMREFLAMFPEKDRLI